MDDLIRYICIPFAVKLYKEDRELFKGFKTPDVYLNKIDGVLDQLHQDFYKLKVKYNQVRKIGKGKYKFNGEIYEFGPEKLKKETADIMKEYLFTVDALDKDRIWPDADTTWKP